MHRVHSEAIREAERLHGKDMTLRDLVEKAFTRLRRLDELFVSKGYKSLVLFSGGKDSLVVLDLCYRYFGSDFYVAYIHIPGNTHEECDYYVLCTVERYLGSLRRFYYLYRTEPIRLGSLGIELSPDEFDKLLVYPSLAIHPRDIRARKCMVYYKVEVMKHVPKHFVFISGARASDGLWRTLYMQQMHDGMFKSPVHKHWTLELIYDWPREAVLEYIKLNNLKLNPLYEKISHSGNCMICPAHFSSVEKILLYLNKLERYYPHWYKKVLDFMRQYMQYHRERVKCNMPCSKCPYLRDKNRYIMAKRIGVVLELLDNSIVKYLQKS